jgi:hypothetical protein
MSTPNSSAGADPGGPGSTFDPARAAPSRTYNAFRGAQDAYAADREAADELRRALDGVDVDEVTRENGAALVRAVRHLAGEGFTQYADLGGGRPMGGINTGKLPDLYVVACEKQPPTRWLLLDSDLTAVIAGRALLRWPGVEVVQEDLRDVSKVLAALHDHLDMEQRAAIILGAVLHFLTLEEARRLLDALYEHLAPGSPVVVTHLTGEGAPADKVAAGAKSYKARHGIDIYPRTREEITALVGAFELAPPGVVRTIDFLPEQEGPPSNEPHFLMWMARRP